MFNLKKSIKLGRILNNIEDCIYCGMCIKLCSGKAINVNIKGKN